MGKSGHQTKWTDELGVSPGRTTFRSRKVEEVGKLSVKPDDKNIKWVKEPELGLSGRMYLGPLLGRVGVTGGVARQTARGEGMTRQFPEERPEFGNPLIYRGVHRLSPRPTGRIKCVAAAVRCLSRGHRHHRDPGALEPIVKVSTVSSHRRLRIYCGTLKNCPRRCRPFTMTFDLTGASREEMIFDKEKLLSVYDATIEQEPMQSRGDGTSRR